MERGDARAQTWAQVPWLWRPVLRLPCVMHGQEAHRRKGAVCSQTSKSIISWAFVSGMWWMSWWTSVVQPCCFYHGSQEEPHDELYHSVTLWPMSLYEALPTSSAVSSVSTLLKLEPQPWWSPQPLQFSSAGYQACNMWASGDMLILKPKYQLSDIVLKTSRAMLWIPGPVISPWA